MMTPKYSIPSRDSKLMSFKRRVKIIMQKYSQYNYNQFFKCKGVVEFFKVLEEAGIMNKIIEGYPTLSSSQEAIENVLEEIQQTERDL